MSMHDGKKSAHSAASRYLFDAIELVRADVAKVEFWASAVEQFAQPVPDYEMDDGPGWVPAESGKVMKPRD